MDLMVPTYATHHTLLLCLRITVAESQVCSNLYIPVLVGDNNLKHIIPVGLLSPLVHQAIPIWFSCPSVVSVVISIYFYKDSLLLKCLHGSIVIECAGGIL